MTPHAPQTTRLHQINAAYDPIQDRILLLINTTRNQEFRFWITRRYFGLLWQALGHVTTTFATVRTPTDPFLRSALSDFAEAQALHKADLKKPFTRGSDFPLGKGAVLLSNITITPLSSGQQTLRVTPEHGEGIDIALDEDLTHVLINLLRQAARSAEWAFDFLVLDTYNGGYFNGNSPPMLH